MECLRPLSVSRVPGTLVGTPADGSTAQSSTEMPTPPLATPYALPLPVQDLTVLPLDSSTTSDDLEQVGNTALCRQPEIFEPFIVHTCSLIPRLHLGGGGGGGGRPGRVHTLAHCCCAQGLK